MKQSIIISLAALMAFGFLVAGCGERPVPPAPPSAVNAATADTMVKCPLCKGEFRLGDAQHPNPSRPQVVCPSCGKLMIPASAEK